MLGPTQIAETHRRIAPYIRRTPVLCVDGEDFALRGYRVVLKLEGLQRSGSFKARGAFANLLLREVPAGGVVAASGGNHGAAVAYAARRLGVPATIFVPATSSPAKIDRIRSYGASLQLVGERYADALAAGLDWAANRAALTVHAFDQRETMLGQGTLALELASQAPDLDVVLVAVGGGGLIGGMAAYFAGSVPIVGVEPVDAPAGGVAADSLAPRRVGRLVLPIVQRYVDQVVTVPDGAIVQAQRVLWEAVRVVAEPGAAAPMAALLDGAYRPRDGAVVGVVVSGANTTAVNVDPVAPLRPPD